MSKLELERAQAAFDPAFQAELADVITRAIVDASMIDNVLVIRTGESAAALVTILASILALSPASTRSRAAIKKTADAVRRKLQARVRAAEGSPDLYELKRRAFSNDDEQRGGHG
jgi:hypothetical protein